ncbi:MAG TPA: DUF4032 domain-containing protein, partial [Demequinaceae bacterium]
LNDLDEYRVVVAPPGEEESYAAHQWLTTVFEATVRAVPRKFRAKLEPAQIFHEVLDHRWFLAEAAGRDVPMAVAVASYVKNILPERPDEKAVLGLTLAEMSAERTAEMTAELPALTEEVLTREIPQFEGDNTGAWGRDDGYGDDGYGDDDEDDEDDDAPVQVVRKTTKRAAPKRTPPSAPKDSP